MTTPLAVNFTPAPRQPDTNYNFTGVSMDKASKISSQRAASLAGSATGGQSTGDSEQLKFDPVLAEITAASEKRTAALASADNYAVNSMEAKLFNVESGKVVLSNRNWPRASAVIISDQGVRITDNQANVGVDVSNSGITMQGTMFFTGKGRSIKKGEYSENPNSARTYSYTDTPLYPTKYGSKFAEKAMEEVLNGLSNDIPEEVLKKAGLDSMLPLITDEIPIGADILPHAHTITMKHIHRIEPAYLYRVPPQIGIIQGAQSALKSFYEPLKGAIGGGSSYASQLNMSPI